MIGVGLRRDETWECGNAASMKIFHRDTMSSVSIWEPSIIHHDGGVAVDEEGFFSEEKKKPSARDAVAADPMLGNSAKKIDDDFSLPLFEPQPEDVDEEKRKKERNAETRTAVSLTTRFGENVSRLNVVVVRSWLLCQLELIVGEPKLLHMCVSASASQHEPKSRSRREENPRKISWKKFFNELTISCCWSSRLYKTNSLTRVGLN